MRTERKLSIVIPVYNEEGALRPLYDALIRGMDNCAGLGIGDFEIWFVSDGSTDGSEAIIRTLIRDDSRVKLIAFRSNFGKATALQAGFRRVEGDIIVTMDADLQDDPSEIRDMVEKLDEGFDMVSGWKVNRQDPLEKRLPSKLFNGVTAALSGVKLHDFNCGFKAYRKEVVDGIDVYGELHRYIPVLASRKGFRIAEIPVTNHKREFGKSKYGAERYLRGLFDSLTTSFLLRYYDRPMHFFGKIGLFLLIAGIVICGALTAEWFMGHSIGGRPLLILGILCVILGVQSISTGFIGDLIVDATFKNRSDESSIREIVVSERAPAEGEGA
ncbi:MAG: glycosyltransferase family 2 protein [Clostridiales Family XIII bacterium]|jgi:glycosyltransferase involved in cell wall biosynthesis|nr:glycosyltransferase family 2 protein [Clostridiales Family XIII bacterium]